MHITSVDIQGFGCYRNLASFRFEPTITTLVGENSTGKSTVSLALTKLLAQALGGDHISPDDYPFGNPGELLLAAAFSLSSQEVDDNLISPLVPEGVLRMEALWEWFRERGTVVRIVLRRPGSNTNPMIEWGDLTIQDGVLGVGSEAPSQASGELIRNVVAQAGNANIESWIQGKTFNLQNAPLPGLAQLLIGRFRLLEEFRTRSITESRTGALESMSGRDTATALFNLKNHTALRERRRYADIIQTFHNLFPRYTIEAVEASPGSSVADVAFTETGQPTPIPLPRISAGLHQSLTLLTNLVGREGFILFLEHPEQHLHSHAIRFLQGLMSDASTRNQIIVATHDPQFVDPTSPLALRRFWWTEGSGTLVRGVGTQSESQTEQIKTALRHLGQREVVFARAAILVEDESQRDFLLGVADTLGYSIDALGISVVSVDGDAGYSPYITLVESLGIPFVALKDKQWGDRKTHPAAQYFSFMCELEDFLDNHGLKEKRQALIKTHGKSKRRIAGLLGASLIKSEVPPLFARIFRAASALATGEPAD